MMARSRLRCAWPPQTQFWIGDWHPERLVALRDRYALKTATPALLQNLEREEWTADLFADNDDDQEN